VRDLIDPARDLGHVDRAKPVPSPQGAQARPASPIALGAHPVVGAGGAEDRLAAELVAGAGARTGSIGRGGAEEEELEHEEMSLRVQPGGERYERVGEEGGGGEEETGVGVPPGGAGEGEAGKRNFDGTVCEDCV